MSYPVRRALALALVGLVAAAVIVLVAVFAPRWGRDQGGTFSVRDVRVSTSLDPRSALIGDVVTATARIFVDADEIDPSSVTLRQQFTPFGTVRTRRSVERGIGSAARVDYRYTLQCVTVSCLTLMEQVVKGRRLTRSVAVPTGTLTYAAVDGSAAKPREITWPTVVLRSRLNGDTEDVSRPRPAAYRATDVSYSVGPGVLGWLSVGFAIVMALLGGSLVALAVRGHPLVRRLRIPSHLTPIDRAVALARHARAQGDAAGERKALERLAAALRDAGEEELGRRAQRLAWSKELASDDALGALSRELERVGRGR